MANIRDIVEFAEYITPDGETYKFESHERFLMSWTGMGMPPIKYLTQQGPLQHGESIIDYRLQKRIIQLVYRKNDCTRQGYWDSRADLLDFLRPNRQAVGELNPGQLRRVFPDGEMRDIDVMIEQGPVFMPRNTGTWDEYGITETLRFIAADPTFYDPTEDSSSWVFAVDDHLVFPFAFDGADLMFGLDVANVDLAITYTGTWFAFPTITLVGPLRGVVITNESTEEVIRLNHNISIGETVTITLDYGNKSIESDLSGNIIGFITDESDLATFHLAPDPEAPGGVNTINIVSTGVDIANSVATVSYNTRYIGI